VALAPFGWPLLHANPLQNVSVRVLVEGGLKDGSVPAAAVYDWLKAPGCRVIYSSANHFAWVDGKQASLQPAIVADTITFLEATLSGSTPTTAQLTGPPNAKTDCR
jgi:hypothetical protein